MEKTNSLGIPVVTLSNGLRVANFSSPHPFTFTDGTVLPACDDKRAREMQLECVETEQENTDALKVGILGVTDIKIRWALSQAVADELSRLFSTPGEYDVLLVPLPVMTAMKESHRAICRARCVRMADRVTKAAHIDRFCI